MKRRSSQALKKYPPMNHNGFAVMVIGDFTPLHAVVFGEPSKFETLDNLPLDDLGAIFNQGIGQKKWGEIKEGMVQLARRSGIKFRRRKLNIKKVIEILAKESEVEDNESIKRLLSSSEVTDGKYASLYDLFCLVNAFECDTAVLDAIKRPVINNAGKIVDISYQLISTDITIAITNNECFAFAHDFRNAVSDEDADAAARLLYGMVEKFLHGIADKKMMLDTAKSIQKIMDKQVLEEFSKYENSVEDECASIAGADSNPPR